MQHDRAGAPKFSILLPTHNRADVLTFAIRSVLAQTLSDFELLVVGDGCTDETAAVVQGFKDARILWFDLPKAPNLGYANRNIALRQARGANIAFMAHDDLWLRDHLEILGAALDRPGIEIAYSRPLWVAPGGLIVPGTFNLDHAQSLRAFLDIIQGPIPASCFVHRRDCFEKYGYWNEARSWGGDLDMWTRIIKGGGSRNFAAMAEPTCLHFRAHWRRESTILLHLGADWETFRTLGAAVPAALKVYVKPGRTTEQEAVWRLISNDPAEWPRRVRAAVRVVLDLRISETNRLARELADIQGSQAWRIGLFLHRVVLVLAPPGSLRRRVLRYLVEAARSPGQAFRRRRQLARELKLIRSSGLFDAIWYLESYRDVAGSKLDPALHYLLHGAFEGRDPSPEFCSDLYLDSLDDPEQRKRNPLVHYLESARRDGVQPQPFRDRSSHAH